MHGVNEIRKVHFDAKNIYFLNCMLIVFHFDHFEINADFSER